MDQPVLVAYVSGHGFGHFVRSSAVLSRLRGVKTHLRTNGRAFFLAGRADWATEVHEVDVGPGVVQRGPLESDLAATREALTPYLAGWPRLVDEEAAFLRESGARLVYGDVPPLAFAAAARAGIPSVAMANFSWSWIYDGYAATDPFFGVAAKVMREAEAQATLLLELEMGGGLESFSRRKIIAPVARPVARSRDSIRAALGNSERTFVLFSLGGFGDEIPITVADATRHELLATSANIVGASVRYLEVTDELPHHELVAAVDCVIGKPGYGTVAECLRAPTPFCWLPRGDFREWAPLSQGIQRWLPNSPIQLEDLASGRWIERVDEAIASRPRETPPAPDGAVEAAAILQTMLA
jgi:UDP:flavonoid glycosyltransferase YjiC (YdhE family)